MGTTDYLAANRRNWDDRAQLHARSGNYGIERLLADERAISEVVAFDRPLLGDIDGLRTVHLQCHLGTDTLSLHRLGATVEGLDFSPTSIAEARRLAEFAEADITFHEATVDDAVDVLGAGRFDLVYTGIGALCWLPDIRRWAEIVAALLAPGGRLFVRDSHPMLATIDEAAGEPLTVRFPYFEQDHPLRWESDVSYVDTPERLTETVTYEWAHGLGEIVQAVLDAGLEVTGLAEHDSLPWRFTADMVDVGNGEWKLTHHPERLACTFTLRARRPA